MPPIRFKNVGKIGFSIMRSVPSAWSIAHSAALLIKAWTAISGSISGTTSARIAVVSGASFDVGICHPWVNDRSGHRRQTDIWRVLFQEFLDSLSLLFRQSVLNVQDS